MSSGYAVTQQLSSSYGAHTVSLYFTSVQIVFLATLAVALAAPGYLGAPLAAPVVAPYAYAAHAAYAAPLTAYTGISYPAYSAISAPVVSAAYYG